MRVAILASNRTRNFGDLLLVDIFRSWLQADFPGIQLTMPFASTEVAVELGFPAPAGVADLMRADAVLYVGGGYFGEPSADDWRWSLRALLRYVAPGALGLLLRKPTAMLGVGFGPLSYLPLRWGAVELLKRMRVIALRDVESVEFARSYGVPGSKLIQIADAALSITVEDVPDDDLAVAEEILRPYEGRCLIGVHLTGDPGQSPAFAALHQQLDSAFERNPHHHAVVLCDQPTSVGQVQAAALVKERLGDRATVAGYLKPWRLCALLSRLHLVITSKLHVGVVARAMGTPSLSFPAHQKIRRFYDQIDAAQDCISLEEVVHTVAEVEVGVERLLAAGKYVLPAHVRTQAAYSRGLLSAFLASIEA